MTHQFTKLACLIAMTAVSAFATHANADEYSHIDRLAVKIRNNARRITRETVHYRHTREYAHMVSDANELYRLADHIHDVTHFEGNLRHLIMDLDQLDRMFHHLEGLFDQVEHNAAYGDGHVHGNTAHVKRLLNLIENDIHHMREDVNILRRRPVIIPPPACQTIYNHNRPIRLPYNGYGGRGHGGHGHGVHGGSHGRTAAGFGISIGRGNSRIQFNF